MIKHYTICGVRYYAVKVASCDGKNVKFYNTTFTK